jgi:hypothetical protein
MAAGTSREVNVYQRARSVHHVAPPTKNVEVVSNVHAATLHHLRRRRS